MLNFVKLLLGVAILTTFLQNRPQSNGAKAEDSWEDQSTGFSEEDYWSWASSEELECSDEEFWHIRGKRCVPYFCPRGNSKRNFETGECLFSSSEEDTRSPNEMDILDQLLHQHSLQELERSPWPLRVLMGFSKSNGLKNMPMKKMVGHEGKNGKFTGDKWAKIMAQKKQLEDKKLYE